MIKLHSFEREVSSWAGVTVHPHRFGGREFRLRTAELGHIHNNGILDIPFPRPLRNQLILENLAQEHRWIPNSGWTTFHVRTEQELKHALWLMRLSYLRYELKATADPEQLLAAEAHRLRLNTGLQSLMRALLRRSANQPESTPTVTPNLETKAIARPFASTS